MAVLLLAQVAAAVQRLPVKPPATLAVMGLCVAIYFLGGGSVQQSDACISADTVLSRGEWFRVIAAAFVHADGLHLAYNMSSFLSKGVQLELHYGSAAFAALVFFFALASHALYVAVSALLGQTACAVGLSAVIFALKVVLTARAPGDTHVWGFSLPTRYAAWAELILASLLSPRASFLGHLCGILAGYLFLHVPAIEDVLLQVAAAQAWGLAGEELPALQRRRSNRSGAATSWDDFMGPQFASVASFWRSATGSRSVDWDAPATAPTHDPHAARRTPHGHHRVGGDSIDADAALAAALQAEEDERARAVRG